MGHDAFVQKRGHLRAQLSSLYQSAQVPVNAKPRPIPALVAYRNIREQVAIRSGIIFSEKAPDAFTRRGVDHREGAPLTQGAGGVVQVRIGISTHIASGSVL